MSEFASYQGVGADLLSALQVESQSQSGRSAKLALLL